MNALSLIIIGIFIVALIIGAWKGFIKIFLGKLKGISCLLISYFVAKPVGILLFKTIIGTKITGYVSDKLLNADEIFSEIITSENQAQLISDGLAKLKIPSFMHGVINKMFDEKIIAEGLKLANYFGGVIAKLLTIVIGFIFMMLISFIIFTIILHYLKNVNKIPVLGPINQVLGALFNACFFILTLSITFWGLAFLASSFDSVNEFATMIFDLDGDMNLARWLYENNIAIKIYNLMRY